MRNGEMRRVEAKILDERIGRDFPLPSYATAQSAGMDLRALLDEPLTIAPGDTAALRTGIAIFLNDPHLVALLLPRSGLSSKHGIVLANTVGVIDADYQDEIRVLLHNRGEADYTVAPQEKICQLLVVPVARIELDIVAEFSEASERGTGGFGSTGRL